MYKWWCGARGRKLEESKLNWALLAEVVRRGGLGMPLLMRLTFIPSHCTSAPFFFSPSVQSLVRTYKKDKQADARAGTVLTAVFSTCGMGFWIFTASAVLSLPKQLAVVFIGVSGANGQSPPSSPGSSPLFPPPLPL